jgi:hypothetical protein
MRFVVGFARFWYDFIVGDDWRLAAGVVVALVVVRLAGHRHPGLWWLVPVAVAALLGVSVRIAARRAS